MVSQSWGPASLSSIPELLVSGIGGEEGPCGIKGGPDWAGLHAGSGFLPLSFFKTSSSLGTWNPIKEHTLLVWHTLGTHTNGLLVRHSRSCRSWFHPPFPGLSPTLIMSLPWLPHSPLKLLFPPPLCLCSSCASCLRTFPSLVFL